MSPRRVHEGLPANLTYDVQSERYRYRDTMNGKRSWFGRDRAVAIRRAEVMNEIIERRIMAAMERSIDPTFGDVIDEFIEVQLPTMPLSPVTKAQRITNLNLYKADLGSRRLLSVDRVVMRRWIDERGGTASARNRHRLAFVRLWQYAISRSWCDYNEAEAIPAWSRSMKLEGNQVSRKRLSLEQFWQVHELAPLHLQVAMQLSLVTLQARAEVCNMQRDDIRGGELYVARAKTAGSDDAAFIRIQMSDEIERIIALGRQSGIACPYFVHRRPRMKPRRNAAPLPHWAWVKPQAISVAFKNARDRSGVSDGYGPREAPSFHEIRSLGARLMKEQGADKKLIQTLLAHGQASTSALYLDARETVPDERYVSVAATLKLLP